MKKNSKKLLPDYKIEITEIVYIILNQSNESWYCNKRKKKLKMLWKNSFVSCKVFENLKGRKNGFTSQFYVKIFVKVIVKQTN